MKVLIIEDETAASENLIAMLQEIDSDIEVLKVLESVQQTVRWLSSNPSPDLIFMDMTTYEQLPMPAASTAGKSDFLKDGQECRVLLYQGKPLDIDIPTSIVLEVTETEPGVKGDTVSNVTKPATLESGAVIQVPIFVNVGDRVKVNTTTKEYLGRE